MNASEKITTTEQNDDDNELRLVDLGVFFRKNYRALLSGIFFGGVLAGLMALLSPSQWEANALVRVGQLGQLGVDVIGVDVIESPLQLTDRIKSKSFKNAVLLRLGLPNDDSDAKANNFRKTLNVKLEKSELLSLVLRAASVNEAKLQMNAVLSEIIDMHQKKVAPALTRMRQQLAATELEFKRVSTEALQLRRLLDGATGSLTEKTFSQMALLSSTLLEREVALHALDERKRLLEEGLSPERTFSTEVLGGVVISSEPVYPKRLLFVLVGMFFGLFLCVMWLIMKPLSELK